MTNLLETLDLRSKELALGESVDIAFLDFLKAFDMVPHGRLLKIERLWDHRQLG